MEVSAQQRVVWWQGPTVGRLTACFGTVAGFHGTSAKVCLDDGRNRTVPIARLQTVRTVFISVKNPHVVPPEPPLDEWGRCTLHAEIGNDLFPERYIYEFANGNFLCYDRNHWFDDYGTLGTLAFCEFRWMEHWTVSSESDFQQLWEYASQKQSELDLERRIPDELADIKPWERTPVQSAV